MSRPALTGMSHQIAAREAAAAERRRSRAPVGHSKAGNRCVVCDEPASFGFGAFRNRPGSVWACANREHRQEAERRVSPFDSGSTND